MGNKKKQNKKAKENKNKSLIFLILIIVLASFAVYSAVNNNQKQQISSADADKPAVTESDNVETAENADIPSNVDLKILKSEITDEAKFYPYKAGDTYMEVFAVKASDGSIRTALNTCQVCFDSGRGYYKQQGNKVVCQNCGNVFGVDDIEVIKGGCNPVPVMQENKTEDGEYITIKKEFLEANNELFAEWKR
ncbi:MAG: DUF2318 domain-containing protein [Clostridia bacterium]|jgi:uncharacterized membrane protein|nr:DUF2318 domain-containing protein [Clostridia bacterium]HQK54681.1 DUF2318 domain-containing protein [Sedimentibacter sp.]